MQPSQHKMIADNRALQLAKFRAFFQGLPPHYLDNIHCLNPDKLNHSIHVVKYSQAEEIYRTFILKSEFLHRKNWKSNEIGLLLYLVDKACIKTMSSIFSLDSQIWKEIAEFIPEKTQLNCMEKFYSLCPSKLNQNPWTKMEEQILLEIIEKQGMKQWKNISIKLFEKSSVKVYRSAKQCREHYVCFLNPQLKKYIFLYFRGFWTDEQDHQLLTLYIKYGRKWSKLAKQLTGRNQNAIKNRFSLLFQNRNGSNKLYPSEILRKVKRRKEALEKKLKEEEKGEQSESMWEKENEEKDLVREKEMGVKEQENEIFCGQYEDYFAF